MCVIFELLFLQVDLKLPFELSWECGPNMPFAMGDFLQSVVIQNTVYVGGGFGGFHTDNEYVVMSYDSCSGEWTKLPPYTSSTSALVAIENQLVLVSGYEHSHRTKTLGVWDTRVENWTHPYPNMQTGRTSPSAVVYNDWLVVAGGRGGTEGRLSSVEAMNIPLKQWHAASPMPVAWARMKTAIVGNTCYFMGGGIGGTRHTCDVYSIYLPTLLLQLNFKYNTDVNIWKKESPLPTTLSSPLSMSDGLLAFGGKDEEGVATSSILLYKPDSRRWTKVGDMPTPRYNFTCAIINDSELLVAGGDNDDNYLKSVDKSVIS